MKKIQKRKHKNLRQLMLSVSLTFLGCTQNSNSTKSIDFERFTMSVPTSWHKVTLNGVDSIINGVVTNKGDTLFIDFGKSSNPFSEIVQVRSMERKKEYESANFKYPKSMIFSENAEMDEAQGLYLKEYFYYDTISSRKVKLGFPKIIKKGHCIIHFPSVDLTGNKLSMSILNIDSLTQKEIYDCFKSIKFKNKANQ